MKNKVFKHLREKINSLFKMNLKTFDQNFIGNVRIEPNKKNLIQTIIEIYEEYYPNQDDEYFRRLKEISENGNLSFIFNYRLSDYINKCYLRSLNFKKYLEMIKKNRSIGYYNLYKDACYDFVNYFSTRKGNNMNNL